MWMEKVTEPINAKVLKKLRPEIAKMLTQMNVKYAEYKDESVVFHYLDLSVTIQVKSKTKKIWLFSRLIFSTFYIFVVWVSKAV